jgi:hypothetical protein
VPGRDCHRHRVAACLARDSVSGTGGCEGTCLPNAEHEVPTLSSSESRGRKAESENGCRQRDAHEPIVARDGGLGQCSGMTPGRVRSPSVGAER